MLKFLAKVFASKIGKILIEIAMSGIGKALSDLLGATERGIINAEQIGNYIKANIDMDFDIVQYNTQALYKYDLTEKMFLKFKEISEYKGIGKFEIAFNLIKEEMKSKGREYEDYIINFAIEMIFIKMFKQ